MLTITEGKGRHSKRWKVVELTWEEFAQRLAQPVRTQETLREYEKLSKERQAEIKDVGGFVGGAMKKNGRR